jgi:hypothetical protein
VKLCGTNVIKCNNKPPFGEAPKDAEAQKQSVLMIIVFAGKFCVTEKEWDTTTDKTNHIHPLDTGLKEKLNGSVFTQKYYVEYLASKALTSKRKRLLKAKLSYLLTKLLRYSQHTQVAI